MQEFNDRSSYKSFFTRKERRDLSKGKIIIHSDPSQIIVNYGELDDVKIFTGKVVRLILTVDEPATAAEAPNSWAPSTMNGRMAPSPIA